MAIDCAPPLDVFCPIVVRWNGDVMYRNSLLKLGFDSNDVEHFQKARDQPSKHKMKWTGHERETRY